MLYIVITEYNEHVNMEISYVILFPKFELKLKRFPTRPSWVVYHIQCIIIQFIFALKSEIPFSAFCLSNFDYRGFRAHPKFLIFLPCHVKRVLVNLLFQSVCILIRKPWSSFGCPIGICPYECDLQVWIMMSAI